MSIVVHRTGCGEKTGRKTMEIAAKELISTATGDINWEAMVLVPTLAGSELLHTIILVSIFSLQSPKI